MSRPAAVPTFARTVLSQVHEYMLGQGFFYTKQDIANLYLSLKSKPFVILAGISGTGKTLLVRQFAEALGYAEHCVLIPVRPDWTDSADLIGYTDLNGHFRRQALLDLIVRAHQQPEAPFFAILDEMNLARVEYYFSDFLSVMETRIKKGDRIHSDPLLTASRLGPLNASNEDLLNLSLPDNLYLIGTVNMDESTQALSSKVLDRANTIEMSEIRLDWPVELEALPPLEEVSNQLLLAPYVHPRDVPAQLRTRVEPVIALLSRINQVLKGADLQFGYRLRDEVVFYMLNRYEIREVISEAEALDFQLLQKILPRIHGHSRRIQQVIHQLMQLVTPDAIAIQAGESFSQLQKKIGDPRQPAYRFPKSLEKLLMMSRRFEEDGFTSFWL